ncbi:MAG: hypothetical protein HZB56_22290 [Deltaproteobacteria bacterium]|nr:hypothetical protein [Deltaproteobacteria bacterium]
MVKVMAVLRSVFLVFIFLYALKLLPLALLVSSDARRGEVMVPFTKVETVASVTWLAIGWIAFEVVVGWVHVWAGGKLRDRAAAKKAARAVASPPAAPPRP